MYDLATLIYLKPKVYSFNGLLITLELADFCNLHIIQIFPES